MRGDRQQRQDQVPYARKQKYPPGHLNTIRKPLQPAAHRQPGNHRGHDKGKALEPFVPSGGNFEGSKQFFQELGFHINWEVGGYAGLECDGCRFILQHYDKTEFAENFMLNVKVSSVEEFRNNVLDKKLSEKYGIRIGKITQQPYGKEVNVIDLAGVCWHFVEQ